MPQSGKDGDTTGEGHDPKSVPESREETPKPEDEQALDEALEESFPASDPVAVTRQD
jgi:hypothetical protein